MTLVRKSRVIMRNGTTTDYVVWQAQYALGHDTTDQQHQQIVTILNQLYEALRNGTAEEHMEVILDTLRCYAETHLVYEEALLTEIGYPDLAEHRRCHAQWGSKTRRFQARFQTEGSTICHDVFLMAKITLRERTENTRRPCRERRPDRPRLRRGGIRSMLRKEMARDHHPNSPAFLSGSADLCAAGWSARLASHRALRLPPGHDGLPPFGAPRAKLRMSSTYAAGKLIAIAGPAMRSTYAGLAGRSCMVHEM